jgi:hypothetical protein
MSEETKGSGICFNKGGLPQRIIIQSQTDTARAEYSPKGGYCNIESHGKKVAPKKVSGTFS